MDNKLKIVTYICKELLQITLKALHFLIREIIYMAIYMPSFTYWIATIEFGKLNCYAEIANAYSGRSATDIILTAYAIWIIVIFMRVICSPILEYSRKIYDRFLKYLEKDNSKRL